MKNATTIIRELVLYLGSRNLAKALYFSDKSKIKPIYEDLCGDDIVNYWDDDEYYNNILDYFQERKDRGFGLSNDLLRLLDQIKTHANGGEVWGGILVPGVNTDFKEAGLFLTAIQSLYNYIQEYLGPLPEEYQRLSFHVDNNLSIDESRCLVDRPVKKDKLPYDSKIAEAIKNSKAFKEAVDLRLANENFEWFGMYCELVTMLSNSNVITNASNEYQWAKVDKLFSKDGKPITKEQLKNNNKNAK